MLDKETFEEFIHKINRVHQQFCIWMYTNNEFVKYQEDWDDIASPKIFLTEEFSKEKGHKYKNFWYVVISTLQQAWILGIIRLLDSAYFFSDKKRENPRLSLYYIIELLDDNGLKQLVEMEINKHMPFIESIRKQRHVLAHNSIKPVDDTIKSGIENLFEGLNNIIIEIKNKNLHLKNCNDINMEYTEKLSKCGVEEIFEVLSK